LEQRQGRADIYSKAAYWDSKAAMYDESAVSMWRNRRLNAHYEREQLRFIESNLPSSIAGLDALDLGCGTGRIARYLDARGARVTGLDFSESALNLARRMGPDRIAYRHASLFDLDFKGAFDIGVGVGVFTVACKNAAELEDALAKAHDALRAGGWFVIIEPIHASFLHRVLKMRLGEFRACMERVGFEVGAARELHFWPTRLPLALAEWPNWITDAGYAAGDACLGLFGQSLGMGDYRALASRKLR
jgi:SAM-dependent methyltransferase